MNDRIRVLILEDLPTDAELGMREVRCVLPQSEFRVVETREDFLEALESFHPDLILSDFRMPRFDGMTALQLAKELAPDTPFIIVTGSMNEDTAVDCMKAGAWDYIIKEHIKRLGPAVLSCLKQKTLRMDRTQTAAALKTSEFYLRTLIDTIPDLIWLKNPEGKYLNCNPAFEQFFGAKEADIIGKTDYDFVDKEVADSFRDNDRKAMEACGASVNEEQLTFVTTGYAGVFETIKTPMLDAQGHLIGVLGISRDITERKQAQIERERFMAAIDQAAEIVKITDAEGTIQYVNPAFEVVTGYSREEIIGKNPRVFKSGEQDDDFYKELWATLVAGGIWKGRFINKKKDGTLYTEEATISPVKDGSGTIVNYVAVKRDVTEERKLEEQLRQSQKMQSIGQLVGGVAHDFNNLLQVINGYAEIAQKQIAQNKSPAVSIDEITKAGEHAGDLVRQLLVFSRQQVIDPKNLDLNQEIESSKKMLDRLIGEHIRFQFFAGNDLGLVFADKSQIQQVLMNLCVNARDAMPDGGELTIQTKNIVISSQDLKAHLLTQAGRYILLSIADTGCGMDKKTCEKIFEPFFTTKEVGKGTGLGLSTVYGIVKQNNGHIHVYSELGKGTEFKIYLPFASPIQESILNSIAEKDVSEEAGVETILVVEDEEALLKLAVQILTGVGYTVLTAKDGVEAVQVFEEHAEEIDLVMMDMAMPRLGGQEAMKQILAKRPATRHLFVSGYSQHAGQSDDIQEKLLDKPYTATSLLHKIREVLQTGGRGRPLGIIR